MKIKGMFDYTQRDFWGGPWYSYWMLIVVTIFFGFFGGDHLFLRSPTSAILKLIVNIFGLGIWWFYDMIQIFGEKDTVMKHGLSAPIIGPLGIGAGMFKDNQPGVSTSKSPLRYLAYMFLLFFPFGFDLFVAGDTNGALAKFVSTISVILWPVLIIWMIFGGIRAFFMPKTLFTEGPDRLFPYSWFMSKHGPSKLGPVDLPIGNPDECDPGGGGLGGLLANGFKRMFFFIPTLVQSAINIAFPGVAPAVQAASKTVEVGAKTATDIISAVHDPAVATVSTTSSLAQSLPSAVSSIPSVAGQVTGQLSSFTDPTKLQQMAAAVPAAPIPSLPVPQVPTIPVPSLTLRTPISSPTTQVLKTMVGGGMPDSDLSSVALFGLFSLVLLGGSIYGIRRLNKSFLSFSSGNGDKGRERNDAPPKPSRL
jgi:hypothetical protein